MKNLNFCIQIKYILVTFVLLLIIGISPASAQDKPVKSRMTLSYFKDSNQSKILTAVMKYKENKKYKLIEGEVVLFYFLENEEEMELGIAVTNKNGEAIFTISNETVIPVDTSTNMSGFIARYEGSEKFKATENDIEIIDIKLDLKLDIIDSVKMVYLSAHEINFDGELLPIEEADVIIYVPRLYSYLPVGEGLIEEGEFEFEFPNDIPGRDNGELSVIAKIEEHDDYGDVEVKSDINWGTPVAFVNEEMAVSLFGKAPSWMIVVIFIILIGAWYHLFLTLYKLYKIKKLA